MGIVEVESSLPSRVVGAAPRQTVPVVSLEQFTGSPQDKADFVNTLGDALRDVGFFALCDHGISSQLVAESYEQAAEFFFLNEKQKRSYEVEGIGGARGYTSFGKEHAKDSRVPDLKEFWHIGRDANGLPPNVWPTEVPKFRPTFERLFTELERVSMQLLDAASLYLGEPEAYLRAIARGGNSILRIIHYPPIGADQIPGSVRAAAHEDINLITLLCESTAAGLELLERDGRWRPIHSLAGQIIVDSGDMLQNLTNGLLRSTTHRVVNPDNSRERRFSMPFFVHPRGEVALDPLPRCVAKTGSLRYPNITAEQYLDKRLAEIGLKSAATKT